MTIGTKPLSFVDDRVRECFAPLMPKMAPWYARVGFALGDVALFFEVERNFGKEIVQHVCVPNKIQDNECNLAAMVLLRELDPNKSGPVLT